MWRSYHIYTSNRKMFLQILENLQNEYYNSKFFFVQYVDPIGFHFRLRVQSVEQQNIELKINEYFGNIRILKRFMILNTRYLWIHYQSMRNTQLS